MVNKHPKTRLLYREKKPKEGIGFSRRRSKLINSCEYLKTGL